MTERSLHLAQHEAAHVVVGVALGLRLRRAVVGYHVQDGVEMDGFAWFTNHGSPFAHAVMFAAGIALDKAHDDSSPADAALCREIVQTDDNIRTCVRIAKLILSSSKAIHKRVTMALLERNLNGRDIAALARGQKLTERE